MKERNNLMTQNSNSTNTGSSSASSTSSTIDIANTLPDNNSTQNTNTNTTNNNNFLSPYNSNNFMAPPIGGTIKCVTCLGNTVQGKVIAYDQQTKMLALRSIASNKPGQYDYSMVNVSWCSNLEIIEEPSEPPETLSNLNIQKLERRKKSKHR